MSPVLRTLGAFVHEGVRPRSRLARALVPVLAVKVCLVLLAKVFVFGGDHRVTVTPSLMDQRLGAVPAAPSSPSPVKEF